MACSNSAWAQLTRLFGDGAISTNDVIEIKFPKFSIGRSNECNLSIPDNKLVSQKHCEITLDDDGTVYLFDSSTNGTQVDSTKVKHDKVQLNHGDEIHIVFRKSGKENNLAYLFQLTSKLPKDTLEYTQEYEDADTTELSEDDSPPPKQRKVDGVDKDISTGDKPQKSVGSAQPDSGEIEETLLCSICQEILHDCVSLQPCLHTFCAGCVSKWIKNNRSCPTCRKTAGSVAQNHVLRNLIDIYLKNNPDKRRPNADLVELDEANIIKQQYMKLGRHLRADEDDDYYDSDDYSESDDDDDNADAGGSGAPTFFLPTTLNYSLPMCRQCPGYDARINRGGQPSIAATANTSSSSNNNAQPASGQPANTYQCPQNTQRHIICYCCMEPLPDRRATTDTPVTCCVCNGMFCHQYWGCQRPSCRGCLAQLKDLNFDPQLLDTILLANPTESSILRDYMQSKSLTIKDVVAAACAELDRGTFQLNNDFGGGFVGKNINGNSVVCYRCGTKALRQLAYFYRKEVIEPEDLPEAVTNKEDCYWGKNCRTQKKPHHAQKWNHICEQTRFT